MKQIPILQTERLLLRGWKEADLDPFARMMADPEVTRFIGGVQPRSNVWRAIAMYAGLWMLRGYGLWVVERKSDGAFLGRVGLWQPESWPAVELAWSLDRPYWGKRLRDRGGQSSPRLWVHAPCHAKTRLADRSREHAVPAGRNAARRNQGPTDHSRTVRPPLFGRGLGDQ
jgi:Acetyltransferase (GNAT) domain